MDRNDRLIEVLKAIWGTTLFVFGICTFPIWLVVYVINGFSITDYAAELMMDE